MSVEIEKKWKDIWKDILENENGTINKEQLKLELHDYSTMIHQMIKLVCHFSNDSLSKPTYPASVIIDWHNENTIEPLQNKIQELEQQLKTQNEKIEKLTSVVEKLTETVEISANQRESVPVALRNYGRNLDVNFWIKTFSQFSQDKKDVLKEIKEQGE